MKTNYYDMTDGQFTHSCFHRYHFSLKMTHAWSTFNIKQTVVLKPDHIARIHRKQNYDNINIAQYSIINIKNRERKLKQICFL